SFGFFFSSRRRHTRFSRDWSSDVCSSDLPLARGDPAVLGLGLAEKVGLERHHPGAGEKQGRIAVGNEGRTGQPLVPLPLKKGEKLFPQLVRTPALHGPTPQYAARPAPPLAGCDGPLGVKPSRRAGGGRRANSW